MHGTAKRSACSGRTAGRGVRAARMPCTSTASRTLRVMAQAVSSVVDSGTLPASGTSRCVLL